MENGKLLLIVDDESDFREIFGTKFRSAGFRVEEGRNGEEGIKKAKELKPDLVLMDVNMPGMDGVSAAMKLKEDPETKDMRIVFLTNWGGTGSEQEELDRRYSKEIGAAGYLRKTEDLDTLVSKVKALLNI